MRRAAVHRETHGTYLLAAELFGVAPQQAWGWTVYQLSDDVVLARGSAPSKYEACEAARNFIQQNQARPPSTLRWRGVERLLLRWRSQ